MLLASFTLKNPTPSGFGVELEEKLQTRPGVADVLIGGVNDTCSIVYDEVRVSTLMLRNMLQAAGYECNLAEIAPPQKTSCCGGCS